MTNHWIYYSVSMGPHPGCTAFSFVGPAAALAVKAQDDGTPIFHPGLTITKSFYGRSPWRPEDLSAAIDGIGADAKAYLAAHPGEQPLRIQHYMPGELDRWPDLIAEADARDIAGDPELMTPGIYLVSTLGKNNKRVDWYIQAESAAHAMLFAQFAGEWTLYRYGCPRKFHGDLPNHAELHDAILWSMETGIDDFPDCQFSG